MFVFELPRSVDPGGVRVATLGSCRVRDPLQKRADLGEIRVCDAGLSATHTAAEALQAIDFITGAKSIPTALWPLIFGDSRPQPTHRLARLLAGGIDIFVLEVSDDRQLAYGDVCLQQNFISLNLVQPHRGALLAWYRQVGLQGAADPDCVAATLRKLAGLEGDIDPGLPDLLAGVRREEHNGDQIAEAIASMMERTGGRWIVVGGLEVAGRSGAIMDHRRALNARLRSAAKRCGALFHDPSTLIAIHGVAGVLASDGANPYEFAPDFVPTAGAALVELVRGVASGLAPKRSKSFLPNLWRRPPPCPAGGFETRRALADRVNAQLAAFHRRRLEDLGLAESGLFEHYRDAIAAGGPIGVRERAVLEIISAYLPPYDTYVVMRAGLGELALLLAAAGRRVIAYEPHSKRRPAIEAGLAHLTAGGVIGPGMLTLRRGVAPDGPLGKGALGVGLDVVCVSEESAAAPLMRTMAVFDAALVDLRLLFNLREEPGAQAIAAGDLARIGFDRRADYPLDEVSWFSRSKARKAVADGALRPAAAPRPDRQGVRA